MTHNNPNVDWDLLLEAISDQEFITKLVAERTYHVIQQLSIQQGEIPTLRSMAYTVHVELGKEGYDREVGTIENWYRVAAWVADNNGGEVEWLEHRSFSEHKRAQNRGWTWLRLAYESPPSRPQGTNSGGLNWKQQLRLGLSTLLHAQEMVMTAHKYAHGYERNRLDEVVDLLDPLDGEEGTAKKLNDIIDGL